MKRELEQRDNLHCGLNHGGKDRSDWIAKYLDLADKLIEPHVPPPGEREKA